MDTCISPSQSQSKKGKRPKNDSASFGQSETVEHLQAQAQCRFSHF